MSTVLLKGSILNYVAHVEDESVLQQILNFCISLAQQKTSDDEMPPEVLEELKLAFALSFRPENQMAHEVFQIEKQQWKSELFG